MDARLGPGFTREEVGDFDFLPGRQSEHRAPAPPPAGAHKGFQPPPPSRPSSWPVPTPCPAGPSGMLSGNQGADSARRGSACAKARGGKLAQEHRGPTSCSVPGSAPGRGGRAEPAGASLWAPGGGAVRGWRSGGGCCRKPGALGCGGGGWCCDRSAGPAPFGNPPPSGPPPPRPRPRLRPRPAPGARSKLSDMLLLSNGGLPPPLRIGRAGGAGGRGAPVTAAPHSGLMEEAGGPCSVLRAPGPGRRAAAQRPPPRLPSA